MRGKKNISGYVTTSKWQTQQKILTVETDVIFVLRGFSGLMVHSTGVLETMLKGRVIIPRK
jgi:hypothetical protein